MTAQLAPAPVFRSWDNLGFPLVGGKLNTYQAGTTIRQATYTDSTQGTPNTNPVILNFRGEAFVWLDPTLTYKFVLTDAFNNLIWTEDNIPGNGATASGNIIPTADNTFTLGNPSFSWANIYLGPSHAPALDTVTGNIGYYARTAAESAAGVTPNNFVYAPGIFERYGSPVTYTAINNALLQSAQPGGSPAKALARNTYNIGANTLAIPDNGVLDISSASLVSTNATVITFGSNTTLFGYDKATIVSSGSAGTALKKTNTGIPAAYYIFGWPYLSPTTMGTAGGVGLDFTAAYKGVFEINIEGYETNVIGGANADTPQTYYNEFRSPRITCTLGLTGMRLQRGCNATTIINPQINGALVATKGIHLNSSTSVGPGATAILGGYIEGFLDNSATRGLSIADATNLTVTGTTFDSASTTANFAIGVTGVATQCNFYGLGFGTGWASSTKIMSWASSGVFTFIGGAPTNQICLVGQSTFNTGELDGTTRIGKLFGADMNMTTSAGAAYGYQLANTADGQGLLLSNNSSNLAAARSVATFNRVGGPGYVFDVQNNGSASGGLVFGSGSPAGAITAVPGTLYINTAGGVSTTFWVKESGTGSAGWAAK